MLDLLLPKSFDNTYRGQKLALWIFGLFVLMKSVIGINTIINGRVVITSADGIPLDTYPPAAAQSLVAIWALLGLSHIILGVLGIIALIRYRSMIPFLFALFLLQQIGGRLILQYIPLVRIGAPPAFAVNLIQLSLLIAGLALSLWRRRDDSM
jgi:hypothetical protein